MAELRKELIGMAQSISSRIHSDTLKVTPGAPDLQRFSVFDEIPREERDSFLQRALQHPTVERAMGSLVGMAVADAVGAPLEFLPACEPGHALDPETLQYTQEYNKFHLQRGQWTDDCSMGLCMADSLLVHGQYNGSDMRVRFWNWWFCNYNNAFRKDLSRTGSVGLGGNISNSLNSITQSDGPPPPRYNAKTEDSGNGSLMRLAPVPVFFHQDVDTAIKFSVESSYTTHPGPIAAEACGFVGYVICQALMRGSEPQTAAEFLDVCATEYIDKQGLDKTPEDDPNFHARNILKRLLRSAEPAGGTEHCWNWRDPQGPFIKETLQARGTRYNGYPVFAGYFGSYSIDGLAIALHSIYHTSSFMDAISKCVNFLGDADSTGSITGQIAGAFYGYAAVDPRCTANLHKWDDREVELRGALLCLLGSDVKPTTASAESPAAKRAKSGDLVDQQALDAAEAEALRALLESEDFEMFTVVPRDNCPHLTEIVSRQVHPAAICEVCAESECWVCGACGALLCSRYKNSHMLKHAEETGHVVALSLSDLSFWCFKCDAYLDVYKIPELQGLYCECHLAKFGNRPPMPGGAASCKNTIVLETGVEASSASGYPSASGSASSGYPSASGSSSSGSGSGGSGRPKSDAAPSSCFKDSPEN